MVVIKLNYFDAHNVLFFLLRRNCAGMQTFNSSCVFIAKSHAASFGIQDPRAVIFWR